MADAAVGLISLVIPVYNEAENVDALLDAVESKIHSDHEALLVYDFDEDSTIPVIRTRQTTNPKLRLVRNDRGPGVLNAIKTGFETATGDVVCVVMADLSDDVGQIDHLARMVRTGATVAVASRYMRGGRQVGGPLLKNLMSRTAGLTLHFLTGIRTHDPTNNFKAYSADFIRETPVESDSGFEVALEMTTKAHLRGGEIAEIPTTWTDRVAGDSRFDLVNWTTSYLRWYLACIVGTWTGQRRRALSRQKA